MVPPPPYGTTEPYVIVVERPRRRRWPWLLGGLAGLGQAVIVCAWADHGSIGAGIFYGGWTMDDAAEKLRDLRAAVVRRG